MGLFIFSVIFFILLISYMVKEAFRNHIEYLTLEFDHFPDSFGSFTIFFISDIHRRNISPELIQKARGKADVVIIGGDLTEKGVPIGRTKRNIEMLKEIAPVYFVWGNNDYEVNVSDLRKMLIESGTVILENSSQWIESQKGERLYLVGIDEISFELDSLEIAFQTIDEPGFKITICHNPVIVHKMKDQVQTNLLLCGHTHGGQINFFGFGLYPVGRLYHLENMILLVSNGYGTTKLPLRFWARAETHLISLKKK